MPNTEFIEILKIRFESNMNRHADIAWKDVRAKLDASEKILSLIEMEQTGGDPDVIGFDNESGEYVFCDCSEESPAGRRNVCYDREGQDIREKNEVYPDGNALDMAAAMGAEILDEEQYKHLQRLGEFDTKTSSWVKTPAEIRNLGGAIFADRRYNHVFIYHNSAETFYSSRGFRVFVKI